MSNDTFPVLTVTQLTRQIQSTLQESFPYVAVTGEISNLRRNQSGHVYLSLKDRFAQLRAVIWKSTARFLRFDLQDGLEVICQGEIDVYPPAGNFQLIIRQIEPKGMGALQLALRQLKEKLEREGLFDRAHKKPLPRFPQRIALVTSPSGAAIHDFLQVVRRRWKAVHLMLIPARVQGEGAAADIARGIRTANRLQPPPDVLVVGRGGGSLEDLWCFNEERLVRAIFASRVPVVSAVGHEIDVTLSDLVADVRALTPTEAAERVVPSRDAVLSDLMKSQQRLINALRGRARTARMRLDALANRRLLRRPFGLVQNLSQQLDDLHRMATRAVQNKVARSRDRVTGLAAQLESLSPLAVLARGYSVTQRASDGQLVRDPAELSVGEPIITRLEKGQIASRVEEVGRRQ